MKKSGLGWGLALLLAACTTTTLVEETVYEPAILRMEPRQAQPPMPEMSRLTKAIANALEQRHYRPRAIDDALSADIYDRLIRTLDPMKLLLTQEDLESLGRYRDHLDDEINYDRLSFPWIVSELVSRRAEEFIIYARILLESEPDCTTGQSFLLDRAVAQAPKDDTEQQDLWSAFIKNELIRVRIQRRITTDTPLHFPSIRLEDSYLAQMPENNRVMLRLKQYTHSVRFPPQRACAQHFLSALAQAFDPHCIYNAPQDFNRRMSGLNLAFAGVGVTYNNEEGIPRVTGIVPDGPAAKEGHLSPGDYLLTATETGGLPIPLEGLPADAISDLIRGPKGTEVIFEVASSLSPDSPIRQVSITRNDIIHQPAAASAQRRKTKRSDGSEAQVGVIRLPIFYVKPKDADGVIQGASDEMRKLIAEFTEFGTLDGIVLDLRNNPGGYLPEAIRVANLFLPAGPMVQVKSRENTAALSSSDTQVFYTGPLVVLVNRHSASASEIVAGAIKDYRRGLIVGDETTFGKGTVQQVIDMTRRSRELSLPDPAGGISLTTSMFFRVSGSSTQIAGVPADIVIPSSTNNAEIGERLHTGTLPHAVIPAVPYAVTNATLESRIPMLAEQSRQRIDKEPALKRYIPTPAVDSSVAVSRYAVIDFDARLREVEMSCRNARDATPKASTDKAHASTADPVLDEAIAILGDLLSPPAL